MADDPTPPDSKPELPPVAKFRGAGSQHPLHPMEKRFIAILGVHLCFLPWALGTMRPWSQLVSLALAAAGFAATLWPRDYTRDMPGIREPYRLLLWPRLRRFPVFWIGLALIAYLALQGLNPSWRFVQDADSWWLTRVRNLAWLPASIEAPFARFNLWRQLINYAAAWLLVCSVWVGLTRRRSVRIVLMIVVINAIVLVAVLGFQRITGDHHWPWPIAELTPREITASFVYENHAGAYIGLAAFTAVALATWYYDHGRRSLAKSSPTGVFALAAVLLAGGVFFTLSRGAGLVILVSLCLYLAWLYLRLRFQPAVAGDNPAVTRLITFVFLVFVVVTIRYLDFSDIYQRWDSMLVQGGGDTDVRSRVFTREAATDMFRDHWLRGVGGMAGLELVETPLGHLAKRLAGGLQGRPAQAPSRRDEPPRVETERLAAAGLKEAHRAREQLRRVRGGLHPQGRGHVLRPDPGTDVGPRLVSLDRARLDRQFQAVGIEDRVGPDRQPVAHRVSLEPPEDPGPEWKLQAAVEAERPGNRELHEGRRIARVHGGQQDDVEKRAPRGEKWRIRRGGAIRPGAAGAGVGRGVTVAHELHRLGRGLARVAAKGRRKARVGRSARLVRPLPQRRIHRVECVVRRGRRGGDGR
jgi:O-Antigen ligase